jgi:hypothetical protein
MRKGIGYALVGLIAWILAANVANRFGPGWGGGLVACYGLAALASTERARALIALFRRHVDRNLSNKEAAYTMGVHPSHVSNGLSGKEHLSFTRAAELPDVVWEDFSEQYLKDRGFTVVRPGALSDLIAVIRAQTHAIAALVATHREGKVARSA